MKPGDELCDVLLLAAGRGERLGGETSKARVQLSGIPLFLHALRALASQPRIERIVLVAPAAPEGELDEIRSLAEKDGHPQLFAVVPGGEKRQDSAWAGLRVLKESGTQEDRIVLVHDAARPNVSARLIERCVTALRAPLPETEQGRLPGVGARREWGGGPAGAIPGLPVRETLKMVFDGRVVLTQPREGLYAVQTPQAFRFGPLYQAHRRAREMEVYATDDAGRLVEGESANLKVTYPEDLVLAEHLARLRGDPGVEPRPGPRPQERPRGGQSQGGRSPGGRHTEGRRR
jgi:2-C-methyl-D-erythritol 4-phosphate cytidylyltransferase